ncbi:o-succinylbenzoate--CoA ligase [Cellulomonas fimi]|uniref:AMP-dependent synthetase and ligase n=1 Tax=Cellulomonas fimi (strain ATCC 484 / DSM 20113 / JCM 1341 / CCUG 24087 / LMG 16345 / NBRC 15513 / NCIMB 8980 / NCTC 7547 / NRS-133) TaxID=590998 RepID=F4H186_CELFA|nr:o-succinylbenzoate--CoA ligase [Cellulomonas fimi]AEE45057.1 AMP-dependent synthetase and ligase [Cellulomonas fimi ATCC 484]NNH07968.1 AMP-binding protein [Cellulomonas fimi]VEH28110.1 2-succinylbenzoate--CoA ligase [Cellulomonas fimi]
MTRLLRDVPARAELLLPALRAALDDAGPAVAPVALGAPAAPAAPPGRAAAAGPARPDEPAEERSGATPGTRGAGVPDDVAVVVRTSGSTGEPRGVLLTAAALRASAAATGRRLGGPGRWLLALPAHHVAGLQVLVRSVLAGTTPTVLPDGPFRAATFRDAVAAMPGGRRYTSLVPTQLVRVLDDPDATAALGTFDAVLLGGAATPPDLRERARDAGVRVVTTYGMTETCGGCVYDGMPLDGVRVALDEQGRVLLAGPVLAAGYLGRPDLDAQAFAGTGDARVLRTSDLGRVDDGVLTVLGRLDDVLVTGGAKVAPAAVEAVLSGLDEVAEVCVVGVPDDEWGQAVVAVVVPRGGRGPSLERVRSTVAARLGAAHAPRRVVVVPALPLRGPGKVDRAAVARLVQERTPAAGPSVAGAAAPGSRTAGAVPAPTGRSDA